MPKPSPPELCPQCGAWVPPDARACPECGSDEQTGWHDRAQAQRLDLPPDPDEFDYDSFVAQEMGTQPTRKLHPVWAITAVILLALLLRWLL
jgi:hypothetical protein